MKSNDNRQRLLTLAVSSALATTMLAGCTSNGAPRAEVSANQAATALAKGQTSAAVSNAEAAVMAEPRNAHYRAMLGAAYLESGRFASAATSFDDAMALGDNSPRTALSLALALAGAGQNAQAVGVLNDWEGQIAASDLGLAFSLAGQPQRGIHILTNAIRGGDNNAKVRQNLAYSYALAGRWREARLMAAEDIPAGDVSQRIGEWAQTVQPGLHRERVAGLLNVPTIAADPGQPAQLAIGAHAVEQQLASEASAAALPALAQAPQTAASQAWQDDNAELPPLRAAPQAFVPVPPPAPVASAPAQMAPQQVAVAQGAARPETFEDAFDAKPPQGPTVAAVTRETMRFAAAAAPKSMPIRKGVQPDAQAVEKARTVEGSHMVQLGSFSSEQGARRAWGIYAKRYPELSNREMVITQAVVKGKNYWRVSAAGFGSKSASAMCGKVKAKGQGCIAWHEARPLPGAVDSGVRMARR